MVPSMSHSLPADRPARLTTTTHWSASRTTPNSMFNSALRILNVRRYQPSPSRTRICRLLLEISVEYNPISRFSRLQGSGAHGRNGRDPAVDQEVCPDDVRRIVRREVNRQLRDFQRIGHPLAWIVGSEDVLNRLALLFAWEATEHRRVRRAWA